MKNKKVFIIILMALIILLLLGVIAFLLINNKNENTKKYDKAVKKYERIVRVAEEVNKKIDKKVVEVQKFIDKKPDVGANKTTIQKLEKTVSDLENLKIEIPEKSENLNELNESIEKIKYEMIQVDENILKNNGLEDEETDNNGLVEEVGKNEITSDASNNNGNAIGETNVDELDIVISEDSNLNILISNLDVLTEDVNKAVKVEAERKAEEERKAKEEAEKKAKEEAKKKAEEEKKKALANVLKGDFTYFAGTYVSSYNSSDTLVLSKSGKITVNGKVFASKPISIKKQSDGSYLCITKRGEMMDDGIQIYPIGVSSGGTDVKNKVRIMLLYAMGATPYIKK